MDILSLKRYGTAKFSGYILSHHSYSCSCLKTKVRRQQLFFLFYFQHLFALQLPLIFFLKQRLYMIEEKPSRNFECYLWLPDRVTQMDFRCRGHKFAVKIKITIGPSFWSMINKPNINFVSVMIPDLLEDFP